MLTGYWKSSLYQVPDLPCKEFLQELCKQAYYHSYAWKSEVSRVPVASILSIQQQMHSLFSLHSTGLSMQFCVDIRSSG